MKQASELQEGDHIWIMTHNHYDPPEVEVVVIYAGCNERGLYDIVAYDTRNPYRTHQLVVIPTFKFSTGYAGV